jgi:copper chaperone CopZ
VWEFGVAAAAMAAMAAAAELRLQVGGIHCGNCVNAVETALLSVEGVVEASVQLHGAATVRVTSDDSATAERVIAAVEGTGKSVAIVNTAASVARRNRRAVNALMIASTLRMFAVSVRMQSEGEIWLRAYDGDFAAQVKAQSLLESVAGALGFLLNPICGGISDTVGRKPVMMLSPVFMAITAVTLAWSPSVAMLCLRRFLMPLSSTPWHTGENACLGDMFKDDPSAYALAKSRIKTLQSATSIGLPIVGGWLAARDIRLPWLVAAIVHGLQTLLCASMLQETLPAEQRRPFNWRRSTSPLSFVKLFTKGRKLRLIAIKSIWASLGGQYATYRYAEVHRQQLLNWDLQARGRYAVRNFHRFQNQLLQSKNTISYQDRLGTSIRST